MIQTVCVDEHNRYCCNLYSAKNYSYVQETLYLLNLLLITIRINSAATRYCAFYGW